MFTKVIEVGFRFNQRDNLFVLSHNEIDPASPRRDYNFGTVFIAPSWKAWGKEPACILDIHIVARCRKHLRDLGLEQPLTHFPLYWNARGAAADQLKDGICIVAHWLTFLWFMTGAEWSEPLREKIK